MNELINDILSLSKVSMQEISHVTVDLSALAQEIAASLRESEPERDVHLVIKDNMHVAGDERLLRLVLQNLLNNAFKYTKEKAPAQIEVGSTMIGSDTVYFVKDNGAGFDMENYERLFAPFKRLHAESEFPGTGIGLAIVERVIYRHGGRVWAQGEVGRGATFFFTIGQHEADR